MGVSMGEVFNTLQVYLGSLYINDFNRFGRTWQVNVQGDTHFRKQIADLKQLIELAYGLRSNELSGGPDWINSERYDLDPRPEMVLRNWRCLDKTLILWSTGRELNPRILVLQTSALATSPPVLSLCSGSPRPRAARRKTGTNFYCGCAVVRRYGFTVL